MEAREWLRCNKPATRVRVADPGLLITQTPSACLYAGYKNPDRELQKWSILRHSGLQEKWWPSLIGLGWPHHVTWRFGLFSTVFSMIKNRSLKAMIMVFSMQMLNIYFRVSCFFFTHSYSCFAIVFNGLGSIPSSLAVILGAQLENVLKSPDLQKATSTCPTESQANLKCTWGCICSGVGHNDSSCSPLNAMMFRSLAPKGAGHLYVLHISGRRRAFPTCRKGASKPSVGPWLFFFLLMYHTIKAFNNRACQRENAKKWGIF